MVKKYVKKRKKTTDERTSHRSTSNHCTHLTICEASWPVLLPAVTSAKKSTKTFFFLSFLCSKKSLNF